MSPRKFQLPCFAIALALACSGALAQDEKESGDSGKAKVESKEKKDPDAKPNIPKNALVDGTVWGAVVYATNDPKGKDFGAKAQKELPDLNERLAKIKQFKDYKKFDLVGQHTQKIFSEYTNWVVPSKELFLNVDSKGPDKKGGINLHVQLWQRNKVLVKTDTKLKKGSPLIIGGPKYGEGQLIFVLLLK